MRRRPPSWRHPSFAAAVVVLTAACIGGDEIPASAVPRVTAGAGGQLVALDSVVLQESDTQYVGRPGFVEVGPDGDYFVSDRIAQLVRRFDRTGAPRGTIGRKGKGPGEFASPGPIAFLGDSLVAVEDLGRSRLQLFDRATGEHRAIVRHEQGIPISLAAVDGRLWSGMPNTARKTGLTRLDAGTAEVQYLAAMPPEFQDSGLEYAHPFAPVAAWADTVVLGYAAHPLLFVHDSAGELRDTLRLPVRARRGLPVDLLERYRAGLSAEQQVSVISLQLGLWHLPGGEVVVLHVDGEFDARRGETRGGGHLSVLRPDLRTACLDIPVAASESGFPVLAFHGDTLIRAEQRTVEGQQRAETVVRRYLLDTSACDWAPVAVGGVTSDE